MVSLAVASKANHATLLPTLLVATFIAKNDSNRDVSIAIEATESLGLERYAELKISDGRLIHDKAALRICRTTLL